MCRSVGLSLVESLLLLLWKEKHIHWLIDTSFLVIHKVKDVGIFLEVLVKINLKSWELNQFQCGLSFAMELRIHTEVTDFSILLIFKYEQ